MKRFYTLLLILFATASVSTNAQTTWVGGATGNWQDGANWSTAAEPAAGADVVISTNTTISGTASNTVGQIKIGGTVTLNLDVNIDATALDDHAIQINSGGNLTLGDGANSRTYTITTTSGKYAFAFFAGGSNKAVTNRVNSTVTANLCNRGVSLNNATGSFINEGTLNITGSGGATAKGVYVQDGTFTNSGLLDIDNSTSQAIDNEDIFNNSGTVDIDITTGDGIFNDPGTFTNTSNITITGGNSDGIDNSADFNNNGGIITIENANTNSINQKAGTFDNTGGSITMTNAGSTTDNGILSTGGIFTNNGNLNIFDMGSDGIAAGTNFNNFGNINVDNALDDCIEVTAGLFFNQGMIDVLVEPGGTSGNYGVVVNGVGAKFTNSSGATVIASGGTGSNGRAVGVTAGELENSGKMTLSGGNPNRTLSGDGGTVNNLKCGFIDLGANRFFNTASTFVNDGYLKSTATALAGSGGTNNGFYTGTANFSPDNGMDVTSTVSIDAGGTCVADLNGAGTGMEIYTWAGGGSLSAANAASGALDITGADFSNTAGPHTITISDGGGCADYNANFTVQLTNVCAASVLPIELLTFTAKPMTNSVMLNWQTATEINNDHMAIERSADGKNYTEIGRVAGAGTTYDAQEYALEDRSPLKGMNYYRLRQVDYDGTATYSNVVSVAFKTDGRPGEMNVFPTILKNGESLNIDFGEMSEEIQLDIFAASGQLMASQKVFAEGKISMPINKFSDGMYILKTNGLHQNLTGRFFVKN